MTKKINPLDPPNAPELDGVVEELEDGRKCVTFTRTYDHSVDKVWGALIDPEQSKNWLGKIEFEPWVGGRLEMILDGSGQTSTDLNTGKILAYQPPHCLEYLIYAQQFERFNVEEHVNRWLLEGDDQQCTLTFVHIFGVNEPARNSILCGWHAMLELFSNTVAGQRTDWDAYTRDRMEALYWYYRNKPRG